MKVIIQIRKGELNKMKKIGIMFVSMFLIFSMFSIVSAEEITPEIYTGLENTDLPQLEIENAGRVPGDLFYGFDKFFDNVRLSMTFNQEKKIGRSLQIAEERLAEAEKLTEEGKFGKAERARLQYEKSLKKAEKSLEKFETSGKLDKSEKTLRAISRAESKFEQHKEKIEEMKSKVMARVADTLTDEEMSHLENLFDMADKRLLKAEEKAKQKKENFFTNHKLLGKLSDKEIKGLLSKIESEEGIETFRELKKERAENRHENAIEAREANLDKWEDKLESEDLTKEEKSRIESKILKESQKLDEFKENFKLRIEGMDKIKDCREEAREEILKCQEKEESEKEVCIKESREESLECFKDAREDLEDDLEDRLDRRFDIKEKAIERMKKSFKIDIDEDSEEETDKDEALKDKEEKL